jgi:hypothetical protein
MSNYGKRNPPGVDNSSFYSTSSYGGGGAVGGGEFSYSFAQDQQFESFDYNNSATSQQQQPGYYDPNNVSSAAAVSPLSSQQNYGKQIKGI